MAVSILMEACNSWVRMFSGDKAASYLYSRCGAVLFVWVSKNKVPMIEKLAVLIRWRLNNTNSEE